MQAIGYASVVVLLLLCVQQLHCKVELPVEGQEYDLKDIISWIAQINNTAIHENKGLRLKRSKVVKEIAGNVKVKNKEKDFKNTKPTDKAKPKKSKKGKKVTVKTEKVTQKAPLGQRRMMDKNHSVSENYISPRSNYLTGKKMASLTSNEKANLVIMEAMAIWRDVNDALQMGDSAPHKLSDLLDLKYPKIRALPDFPKVKNDTPLAVVADLVGKWIGEAVDRIYPPPSKKGSSNAGREKNLDAARTTQRYENIKPKKKLLNQNADGESEDDKKEFNKENATSIAHNATAHKEETKQKTDENEESTTEESTTEESTTEQSTTEEITSEEITTKQVTTEKLTTAKHTTVKDTTVKDTTEKVTTEKVPTEKVTTERDTNDVKYCKEEAPLPPGYKAINGTKPPKSVKSFRKVKIDVSKRTGSKVKAKKGKKQNKKTKRNLQKKNKGNKKDTSEFKHNNEDIFILQ